MPIAGVTEAPKKASDHPKAPWIVKTDGANGVPRTLKSFEPVYGVEPGNLYEFTWNTREGKMKQDGSGPWIDHILSSVEPRGAAGTPVTGEVAREESSAGGTDREYRIVWQACFKAVCQLPREVVGDSLTRYIEAAHAATVQLLDGNTPEDAGPPDAQHPTHDTSDIPF